ncbi:hypothetical protein [Bradyrhizobium murdochi]|uniref:hypothetical protein n=1 Tax=Bradyrhizobium murdochi TaxID=1038859 RepID=UPI000403B988|nr:hypothetical protein [Bradyrhizobium murdochi]
MTAPKKKAQMSVYLDPEVMKTLSAYAARREQPMSLIAEAAIASFLSPDADERREAAIAKRLDQLDRRIARLECQSACKFDASSASNFDPFARRGLAVALGSSELAGIAETRRARVA